MFRHPLCQTRADLLYTPVMLWDPSNMPEIERAPQQTREIHQFRCTWALNQIWGQVKDVQGFSVRVTPEERKERGG